VDINEKLSHIQVSIKTPKGKFNEYGDFNYRSCEDILESLKPFLKEQKCVLILKDDVVPIGDRIYVKATAIFSDFENNSKIENTAFAREVEVKTKMDGAQITGAASSYARKYALAGLFLLDDNKDADSFPPEKPEMIKESDIRLLKMVFDIYPDKGEKMIADMYTRYGIENLAFLTAERFVKFRSELLADAEKVKRKRLEKAVTAFAEAANKSKKEAQQMIETTIGKGISEVMIGELLNVLGTIQSMIKGLNDGEQTQ
jgi:hypothetical protein